MSARTGLLVAAALLLAGSGVLSGCKAREMGIQFADKQARNVDNSWLIAANSCWPELTHSGYSLLDVKRYLADPLHFRATFAAYASLDNQQLIRVVTQPVKDAPAPDTSVLDHSQSPVLTRQQAVSRSNLQGTLPANNNGVAPADALCAIQPGTPVGFR